MLLSALGALLSALGALVAALHYPALALGWVQLVLVMLRVLLGPQRTADLHSRLIARIADKCQAHNQKMLDPMKKSLFESMAEMTSGNNKNKSGALDILEIGVGPGANLEFYPAGSALTCVDPNPHFREYFGRACARQAAHLQPDVRFVVGEGEHLEDVADASMDAVVVTLVLCSVRDVEKVVREARRVLRPGGRFFYLEHVACRRGSVQRWFQDLLTHSGLWPGVLQCWLNRDPVKAIRDAGFSSVELTHKRAFDKLRPWSPLHLMNYLLTGVATK